MRLGSCDVTTSCGTLSPRVAHQVNCVTARNGMVTVALESPEACYQISAGNSVLFPTASLSFT